MLNFAKLNTLFNVNWKLKPRLSSYILESETIDWTGANFSTKLPEDWGRTGALWGISLSQRNKNNPRPVQNLALKIDWMGANFSTKQHQTGAKLNTQFYIKGGGSSGQPPTDNFLTINFTPTHYISLEREFNSK